MARSKIYACIGNFAKATDWKLLVFLLLFLDVKLVVKASALIFIYSLRPDFKFGLRFKNSRLPLFYIIVILIAVFNWVAGSYFSNRNYRMVLLSGIAFWTACILAIHQVKLSVEKNDPLTIHRTVLAFFIVNALASFAMYAAIVFETGTINPFGYQGDFQKYFMGTGDYIKGVTLDTSTTNAVINAFGVLYFLIKKNMLMTILCMTVLLLTASNITNIFLCCIFIGLFIFYTGEDQKSVIVICLMLGVAFMVKISPQNNRYLSETYNGLFNRLPTRSAVSTISNVALITAPQPISEEERKYKIASAYIDSVNNAVKAVYVKNTTPQAKVDTIIKQAGRIIIPPPPIHTLAYQHKNDTSDLEKYLLSFSARQIDELPMANHLQPPGNLPGKIIGLQQTLRFFHLHPTKIITGTGMGNFSSKLAFRATAMKIAGGYPPKLAYINPGFESNHFDLYLSYFTRQHKLHSIINSPNSVYDQLLSEYGLAGITAMAVFYIGFFVKHIRLLTYGVPVLLLAAGMFFIDYWFEQLSVVILLELLLLLNIREGEIKNNTIYGNA